MRASACAFTITAADYGVPYHRNYRPIRMRDDPRQSEAVGRRWPRPMGSISPPFPFRQTAGSRSTSPGPLHPEPRAGARNRRSAGAALSGHQSDLGVEEQRCACLVSSDGRGLLQLLGSPCVSTTTGNRTRVTITTADCCGPKGPRRRIHCRVTGCRLPVFTFRAIRMCDGAGCLRRCSCGSGLPHRVFRSTSTCASPASRAGAHAWRCRWHRHRPGPSPRDAPAAPAFRP